MKQVLLGLLVVFGITALAEDVFKITIGSDYSKYSQSDLQRRAWELERAVWQLQQKVFELQVAKGTGAESWLCTIEAMGDTYTGTGASKAVAQHKATEACKAGRDGDGFFCKSPKCSQ